eukprot:scaffold19162_cov118-Isochrysis_galbana.AAC.7
MRLIARRSRRQPSPGDGLRSFSVSRQWCVGAQRRLEGWLPLRQRLRLGGRWPTRSEPATPARGGGREGSRDAIATQSHLHTHAHRLSVGSLCLIRGNTISLYLDKSKAPHRSFRARSTTSSRCRGRGGWPAAQPTRPTACVRVL